MERKEQESQRRSKGKIKASGSSWFFLLFVLVSCHNQVGLRALQHILLVLLGVFRLTALGKLVFSVDSVCCLVDNISALNESILVWTNGAGVSQILKLVARLSTLVFLCKKQNERSDGSGS